MPFPYDRYPWLNFQELNLAYFIKHFREIFQQWDQLYHDLTEWKEATDQDLADWKTATEAGLESWKTGLTDSLETWKSQTASDISGWESATLAALDAWKTATTAVFEQIRTEAAGSASAAAASATSADTARAAAVSAQTAAEQAAAGISAELAQITQNTADIADLDNRVENLEARVDEIAEYPNLADPNHFTSGYMAIDGAVHAQSELFYTAKIPVEAGQIIKSTHRARFITAFNGDEAVSAAGISDTTGQDAPISYTVPSGIDGLVFTFRVAYEQTINVYIYKGEYYDYIPYNQIAYIKNNALPVPLRVITNREKRKVSRETRGAAFTSNTFISLPVFACARKNNRLIFRANIATLGNFEIGFITSANSDGIRHNRFVIRQNGMTAYIRYNYQTQTMVSEMIDHNLNISGGILDIIIEENPIDSVTITISNNGNTFKHTFTGWVKNTTLQPYCYAAFGSFANYNFTWTCTDLYKNCWIFGDSYMAYSPERWAYYLEQYGYAKNALLNSFPGATSGAAIINLHNLIDYGNPKFIIWTVGMNDGSDSDSAPSSTWANNRDTFIAICEENNVEPIFATIPTVPTVNNEQKNAWIRNSGYRYIDFSRAVNAAATGTWNSGMLSSDGVHPTENGAKALFAEFLLDFPEIMIGLDGVYSAE